MKVNQQSARRKAFKHNLMVKLSVLAHESDILDAIEDDEGDFELNVCWKDILFKLHIVSV